MTSSSDDSHEDASEARTMTDAREVAFEACSCGQPMDQCCGQFEVVPACCGRQTETGECCGHAVPAEGDCCHQFGCPAHGHDTEGHKSPLPEPDVERLDRALQYASELVRHHDARATKAERERDELRELIFIWGEATLDMREAECSEQDTGACASMGDDHYPPCDGCGRMASAWDTLQGIEGVMFEAYEQLREAGYER